MALQDRCVLHDRIEPGEGSDIGAPRSSVGLPTFDDCKFDDGQDNIDRFNYLSWINGWPAPNKGIISAYYKPSFVSTNPTARFFLATLDDSFEAFFTGETLQLGFYSGGYIARYIFPLSFLASDIFHLAIQVNKDNGAGDKIKLYKDGIELPTSSISHDNAWNYGVKSFCLGCFTDGIAPNTDNLRIYDADALIADVLANDINNEGWPAGYIIPNKFNRISGVNAGRPI